MPIGLSLEVNSPGYFGSSHSELLRGLHPFYSDRGRPFSRLYGKRKKGGIVQDVFVLFMQLKRY